MSMEFKMPNLFVTGGSRGIGAAIVRKFCNAGYNVAFTYKKSENEAKKLAEECGAIAIRADSAVPSDIENAVKSACEALGHIDCLINNAAISSFSLFTDITLDEWNDMLSVNLTAPFLYSKNICPDMIHRKYGRIINISSIWGIVGSSCEVHYSACKAGLIGMTKALAKELGPSGITVNAIAPGVIETDMNSALTAQTIADLKDETPVMRIGTADEVADLALYLAGNSSGFITGEVLNISGGFVIT